jgi:hypothetical protein
MIRFRCPHCGSLIEVRKELAGKAGNCKTCQQKIRVPHREEGGSHLLDYVNFPRPEPGPVHRPVVKRSRKKAWVLYGVAMMLGILGFVGFLFTPWSPIRGNSSPKQLLIGSWSGLWKEPDSGKAMSSLFEFEKEGRGSMTVWTDDAPRGMRCALKYRWVTDSQLEIELLDSSGVSPVVQMSVTFPDKNSLVFTNEKATDALQFKRAGK